MILLDTSVVIAFLNGNKTVLKRIRAEIDRITLLMNDKFLCVENNNPQITQIYTD